MRSMILVFSILVYLVTLDTLCSTAAMDSFASSGFMDVESAVTLNDTIISSSPIIRSMSFLKTL